jgi:thiamine-monophosphate kinase
VTTPLGPGGEFDAIRSMLRDWGDLARGVGDDCAVLDVPAGERLCVSTDSSVEDVHFRREWLSPREIGYRATVAALSDLAAMAAQPLAVLAALTVPRRWRAELAEIAAGIGEAVRDHGTVVAGGDTSGGGELSLTITVLGAARDPLLRSGARPGDRLYVTGELGGPLLALRDYVRGTAPRPADRARFARPAARLGPARWLARQGARSAVDVSDGIVADVAHLAAASGVRAVVDLDRLPLVRGADPREAARSGEEYELAVSCPAELDVGRFEAEWGVRLTEVGRVEEAAGGAGVEVRLGGARVDLAPGYDHFST